MQNAFRHIGKVIVGIVLVAGIWTLAQSTQLTFGHVMIIGSKGNGEGQFLYAKGFALARSERHAHDRCIPRLRAGVR
jgi:hypothetical protein